MLAITLVGPGAETIARALDLGTPVPLGPEAFDLTATGDVADLKAQIASLIGDQPVDFAVQALANRRKRLLIADMDSTIINVECLDELADFAGVKDKVSEITERAMRGELAFEGALRERVGMLAGLSVGALQTCYDERVQLNPGARTLVTTMAAHGARCALVSGGFTFFTRRVAEAAGFHLNRANTLIEADGRLTGQVGDPILGKEAKLAALREETAALGLTPADALAVGDGANDLAMIEAAGLGVAYRAKPIVAAQAHAKVDYTDLTTLLYFQGYTAAEFVS
ncbi:MULTISPECIES: phosphoserine phosphatase SerB [unclassified Caulobacter]|uniref:phosphoserine phosphatase SerB n=1 Tax=unclassified Caulobacter TaxID=2648921 RepID=UPI000D38B100|nr:MULTISPECIES: phosphoserine phosphatase SerB [unclassified Caulobacter]PTS91200.1 phosphoserine phosphatase SerB [Caulobacter sp. HMWF009]PTT10208.1 phosphoserine phosphatase SerB [Caulobacter sp. HMWF025]